MGNCQTDDLLSSVYIAAPCPVSWNSMSGDDRVRMCSGCSKNVYNLSAMSKVEAKQFLREKGVTECAVFFRRADGTIITDDCPRGLRMLRDRLRRTIGLVGAFFATLVTSSPDAFGQSAPSNTNPKTTKSNTATTTRKTPTTPNLNPRILRPSPVSNTKSQAMPPGLAGGISINQISEPGWYPLQQKPLQPNAVQDQTTEVQQQQAPDEDDESRSRWTSRKVDRKPGIWEAISPQRTKTTPVVKDQFAKPGERTDSNAMIFVQKGRAAEAKGDAKLAEFYYEKALDFFDAQVRGDMSFRKLIDSDLRRVRKQLGTNSN